MSRSLRNLYRVTITFLHGEPEIKFTTSLGIEEVMKKVQDRILFVQKVNIERQHYVMLEFEIKVEAV